MAVPRVLLARLLSSSLPAAGAVAGVRAAVAVAVAISGISPLAVPPIPVAVPAVPAPSIAVAVSVPVPVSFPVPVSVPVSVSVSVVVAVGRRIVHPRRAFALMPRGGSAPASSAPLARDVGRGRGRGRGHDLALFVRRVVVRHRARSDLVVHPRARAPPSNADSPFLDRAFDENSTLSSVRVMTSAFLSVIVARRDGRSRTAVPGVRRERPVRCHRGETRGHLLRGRPRASVQARLETRPVAPRGSRARFSFTREMRSFTPPRVEIHPTRATSPPLIVAGS